MNKEKKSSIDSKEILNYIKKATDYSEESQYEKAYTLLQRALSLAKAINDSQLIAEIHNDIGRNRYYIGYYDRAMEHFMIALSLNEKINNFEGTSKVFLNIGTVYERQNNLENSLEFFNKSLEIYKMLNDKKGISYALNNMATTYNSMNRKEEAKKLYRESVNIAKNLDDKLQLARCLNNLGDVELADKNFKKALEYFKEALQVLKNLKCDRTLCIVLFNIADAYFNLEDYNIMLHFLNEALQKSQETQQTYIILHCYKLYHTYYEKIENYKEALKYHKLYSTQNESIFNENRSKAIAELQIKYDMYKSKKEKEIYMLKNIELMELNQALQKAYKELEDIHKRDYLTKLYNRKAITEFMEKELFHGNNNTPFVICFADIDDFKRINDKYGHDAGDQVLCHYGNVLKNSLRKTDYIARWGGEEFLIVLPNTDLKTGSTLIEKLRKNISQDKFMYCNQSIRITMTFGLEYFNKDQTLLECIKIADMCLYKGKNSGKNCVCTTY